MFDVKLRWQGVKDKFNSQDWSSITGKTFEVCRWFNIQLTNAFGIVTTVHWSVPAFLAFLLLACGPEYAGLFALALLSVVPHEYAHALAARRYKIKTSRILIYPLGGVALLEFDKNGILNKWKEFWVAAAGPAMSAALAGFGAGALFLTGHNFWAYVTGINLVLTVFNLLPAFPMDGGRMLRAILETRMNHLRATEICLRVSFYFAVFMGMLGLVAGSFGVVLTAVLIVFMGKHEHEAARQHAEFEAKKLENSNKISGE